VADRTDFYFRQRVTEAELDLAFALLEQSDRNLATDIGVFGIISGAVPAPHAPVPDLTIDLTAGARAYDRLGQRVYFGTGQRIDCSVDAAGVPTDVKSQGNERWLGVFLRFSRRLSDPRTDGNSQQVYFRRDESFEFVVRQGVEVAAGAAVPVPLQDNELLVCDIKRVYGRAQIQVPDIELRRRQAFIFARADAVQVTSGMWKIIAPGAPHVQASLDATDALLADHVSGAARRHAAEHIDFAPHGFLASKTVAGALGELVDDLLAMNGTPGAARIGADAIAGQPAALQAGSVRGQLVQLLAALNAHLGAAAGAHAASAITAAPFAFVDSTNVQAQLQQIVTTLKAAVGATLLGSDALAGNPKAVQAGAVHDQLAGLLAHLNQLIADLGSQAAGLGAAKLGNEAIAGSPHAVAAGSIHDQLKACLDALNAHASSGEHDERYPHIVFSNGQGYAPNETKQLGDIKGWPALIAVEYTGIAPQPGAPNNEGPLGPWNVRGPLTNNIIVSVTKDQQGSGSKLAVQNTSNQRIWIQVTAYRPGTAVLTTALPFMVIPAVQP
jgi:hypothetical protein